MRKMKLRHLLPAVLLLAALPAAGQDSLRVFLVGDSTCATKDLGKQNPERGWGHMFAPLSGYADSSDSENIARLQIVTCKLADFCKYLSFSGYAWNQCLAM